MEDFAKRGFFAVVLVVQLVSMFSMIPLAYAEDTIPADSSPAPFVDTFVVSAEPSALPDSSSTNSEAPLDSGPIESSETTASIEPTASIEASVEPSADASVEPTGVVSVEPSAEASVDVLAGSSVEPAPTIEAMPTDVASEPVDIPAVSGIVSAVFEVPSTGSSDALLGTEPIVDSADKDAPVPALENAVGSEDALDSIPVEEVETFITPNDEAAILALLDDPSTPFVYVTSRSDYLPEAEAVPDFAPGTPLFITGGGFAPGSTVDLKLSDSVKQLYEGSVLVDEFSRFYSQYTLPGKGVAIEGEYSVSATGSTALAPVGSSGQTAEYNFLDANNDANISPQSVSDRTVEEGSSFSIAFTATDTNSPGGTDLPLLYYIDNNPGTPDFCSIVVAGNGLDATFTCSPPFGTVTSGFSDTFDDVRVRATDSLGNFDSTGSSDSFSEYFDITVTEPVPNIANIADKEVNEGETLEFTVSATYADESGTVAFTSTPTDELPSFCTIGSPQQSGTAWTATVTCTPGYSDSGSYNNLRLRATANGYTDDTSDFDIDVINEENPFFFGANHGFPLFISDKTVDEGSTISFTVMARDGESDSDERDYPFLLSGNGAMPAFCTVTSSSGGAEIQVPGSNNDGVPITVTCTPSYTDGGEYDDARIVATDSKGLDEDSDEFDITVNDVAYCGNGAADSGEACDDGNTEDGDGCTSVCVVEYCGDGVDNNGDAEACDDGNEVNDDACTNSCAAPVCGDGITQASNAEACDDGNTEDGDGCDSSCQVESGDGVTYCGTDMVVCAMKMDYSSEIECASSDVVVENDEQLEDYLANYGFDGTKYHDLKISYDISTEGALEIHSPCLITIKDGTVLRADTICLDGRKGVTSNGYTADAERVAVMSQNGDVRLGSQSNVISDSLLLFAGDDITLGSATFINVEGPVSMISNGASGDVEILANTVLSATSLYMQGSRQVRFGSSTNIDVEGGIVMRSTGTLSGSETEVTGNTEINAAGLNMVSGNKARLGSSVDINVDGNFNMQAESEGDCTITGSAEVNSGSTSGNCFESDSIDVGLEEACVPDVSTLPEEEGEPVCGNQIIEDGEQCDDGNTEDGDGCDSSCQVEPGICESTVKIRFVSIANTGAGDLDAMTFVGSSATPFGDNAPILIAEDGVSVVDESMVQDVPGVALKRSDGSLSFMLYGRHRDALGKESLSAEITLDNAVITGFSNNGIERQGDESYVLGNAARDEVFPGIGTGTATWYSTVRGGKDGFILTYESTCSDEQSPSCGNEVEEEGEECDDGNENNGDYCTNYCNEAACGDGYVNNGGQGEEFCDDGENNGQPGYCNESCTAVLPEGDGNVQPVFEDQNPEGSFSVEAGSSQELSGSASDADEDELTFSWYIDCDPLESECSPVDGENGDDFTYSPGSEDAGIHAIRECVTDNMDGHSLVCQSWEVTVTDGETGQSFCGNSEIEGAEECDNGEANGSDGVCTSECTLVSPSPSPEASPEASGGPQNLGGSQGQDIFLNSGLFTPGPEQQPEVFTFPPADTGAGEPSAPTPQATTSPQPTPSVNPTIQVENNEEPQVQLGVGTGLFTGGAMPDILWLFALIAAYITYRIKRKEFTGKGRLGAFAALIGALILPFLAKAIFAALGIEPSLVYASVAGLAEDLALLALYFMGANKGK